MALKILYEDNHLLALEKPAGLLTQPTEQVANSLETRAKAFIKERDSKKGNVFLHAVHRLDSQASGIVLFAKSQKALSRLASAMREQKTEKEYLALVEGEPSVGTLLDFLVHGSHQAKVVHSSHPDAKRSELEILSCQQVEGRLWKVRIRLVTGRYHQIRAQLAAHGWPIIGDSKYGSRCPFADKTIALHHASFSFPHPTLLTQIHITSAPPF